MKYRYRASVCIVWLLLFFSFTMQPVHALSNNIAEDTFSRANIPAGWGKTTNTDGVTNYAWQRQMSGSDSHVFLQNNIGILTYEGTNKHKEAGYLPVISNAGGDVLAEISFTAAGHTLAGVMLNVYSGYDWYQADLNTFSQKLELLKRLNSVMSNEAAAPMTLAANTSYWVRLDVVVSVGNATVNARAWADGTNEPSNWQVSWMDTSPLPAGKVGAMGDWWVTPFPGEQIQFHNFAYAMSGLASPAQ